MKKIILLPLFFMLVSCASNSVEDIMSGAQSVVLETTNPEINPEKIKIDRKFGEAQNPLDGEKYYRDYVSYPYYSIKRFRSALDGEIVKIGAPENLYGGMENTSIIVKTGDLEIEYFGMMGLVNPELSVGSKIKKGTYLATMAGGGETGMRLNIRMKHRGEAINPEPWFPSHR